VTPTPPPHLRVERLHGGRPLLEKIGSHPWESKVTFNPASVLVEGRDRIAAIAANSPFDRSTKESLAKRDALCVLLYRAQGAKREDSGVAPSSMGLAFLSPQLELLARHDAPVLQPDKPYDNLGVEDGRITKIGERYFLIYTAYGSGKPKNSIRIAVASTVDFIHWEKHGLLRGEFNEIDNKNAILFGEQVEGKYLMLHRPMEGEDPMSIHWAMSADLFGRWESRGVLMKAVPSRAFKDTWIGGGAPPMRMPNGYVMLYHIGNRAADGAREYDLGIAALDWKSGSLTVRRNELLMRPETPAETTGDTELGVNNVLFVCGAHFYQGDCYFPYAGADSVVLAGKISRSEIDRFLTS
jgi:beta-1,2-mannobiose phosphorylase / 1,2-beta-oligomannan phosphorylase